MSLTLDGGTGIITGLDIPTSQLPSGSILQVQSAVLSTETDLSSSSGWTDTGLSLSITPTSTSSKIILYASVAYDLGASAAATSYAGFRILRDSTVIYLPATGSNGALNLGLTIGNASSLYIREIWNYHLLDSPSATSSITYKIQGDKYYTSTNTFKVNALSSTSDTSRLLALEVAA